MSSNTLPNNEKNTSERAPHPWRAVTWQYKNYASAGTTRVAATAAAKPSD